MKDRKTSTRSGMVSRRTLMMGATARLASVAMPRRLACAGQADAGNVDPVVIQPLPCGLEDRRRGLCQMGRA